MAIKVTVSPATDDAVVTGEFTKETMVDGVLGPPEVSSATASDAAKEKVFELADGDTLKIVAMPSVKIVYDVEQKANMPAPAEPPVARSAKAEPKPAAASHSGSHATNQSAPKK